MNKWFLFVSISLCYSTVISQKMTREQYVNMYYKLAVQEMNLYRIPASITLAQGILETESGNSNLCRIAKNHFGIKCQMTWSGMKFIKDDDAKNECFRAYTSDEESFRDHSTFLLRSRYEKLFSYDISDYRSWAYGLKEAGYATNPNYPLQLIKHIEDLKLFQFDNFGFENTSTPVKKDSVPTVNPTPQIDSATKVRLRREQANNLELVIVDTNFSVYELSSSRKIPIKSLMQYNDLDHEQSLTLGQNFFLQSKSNGNKKGTHEVTAGQSLYDISQIYGVTVNALRKYNKLEPWEQPLIGETIYLNSHRDSYMKTRPFYLLERERKLIESQLNDLKRKIANNATNVVNKPLESNTSEMPKIAPSKPLSDGVKRWITHKVAQKETLFRISKIYECKPSEILEWNNLKLEQGLSVGQVLRIYTFFPNGNDKFNQTTPPQPYTSSKLSRQITPSKPNQNFNNEVNVDNSSLQNMYKKAHINPITKDSFLTGVDTAVIAKPQKRGKIRIE